MKKTRISVAMATYNGETYLRNQIDSILRNISDDDEIVVSDDGSTDNTLNIINEYIEQGIRIRIVEGPGQGVIANFENAIINCAGDYIFLSDQDDVWMDNKVSKVLEAFEDKSLFLVVHDAVVMNSSLDNVIMESFYEYRGCVSGFVNSLIKNRYMGCCMAFRKELRDEIIPIPRNIQMHDQWIGMVNDSRHKNALFLPDILLKYRRHQNNVSDFEKNTLFVMIKNRIILLRELRKAFKRLKGRK